MKDRRQIRDSRDRKSGAKVIRLRTRAEIARAREDAARDIRLAKYGVTSEQIREMLLRPAPRVRAKHVNGQVAGRDINFFVEITIVIQPEVTQQKRRAARRKR
jgi:hypothetical protein